mmetsp:Transcript_14270/g.26904  ORF Transcript_14270/g.26904 Transcript_14270/m.26904 type:complete len:373 (+) Transcript_14270:280-1398(+)|eukprot:CAMPEP_0204915680 /NCGR_PEP_ID=MMETSP1397-20131031/13648_1 /ASSEMBLY_ACC=CAM_ASM_000891 /TAXON_ID=49980 /ORGANISM="Climacostomum Climacostomum virens, Strain Stock W-24" /LENGTH=372 /DNA_ID=CAMNT_0052087847 /DNA_START=130 /DNA_END=1248 /DNA_ORIENTATION=-
MHYRHLLWKRPRLSTFEELAVDDGPEEYLPECSRHLRLSNLDCSALCLAQTLQKFGEVMLLDSQLLRYGEAVVVYYDLRDAIFAKRLLEWYCEVEYLTQQDDPHFNDCLTLSLQMLNSSLYLQQVITQYGEIYNFTPTGRYCVVQYFDLRATQKVLEELQNFDIFGEEEENSFLKSDLGKDHMNSFRMHSLSISSESTTPSPYFYASSSLSSSSSRSSRESPDDFRRKPRKKPLDDEDKQLYAVNIDTVRLNLDPRTTIMIKNIPNKYTQAMLLQSVDVNHAETYDFFYMPIDFKNKCNVGYAFINFLSHTHIIDFYNEFEGKRWERFNSEKICALAYARIQGKAALIQHFQCSSVMSQQDKKVRPLIFPLK